MEKQSRCSLKFTDYKLERIYFEENPTYKKKDGMIPLALTLERRVENMTETQFTLTISVILFASPKENNYPFTLETRVLGFFEVEKNTAVNFKDKLIETNASAILFPYVRSIISQVTLMANTDKTLILPPMNFVEMMREEEEQKNEKDSTIHAC